MNHLLLVLSDGARILEDGWAMDATHNNGTSFKYFSVDASGFANIMNDVLLDHSFGLRLVHW